MSRFGFSIIIVALLVSTAAASGPDSLNRMNEKHLRNIRQLTFGGTNAEAYFSFDGQQLIFQSTRPPYSCDQMF
ncbi:MAG: hypothetical protein ABSE41_16085, partial [Bacteroidota bacterium]